MGYRILLLNKKRILKKYKQRNKNKHQKIIDYYY